MRAWDKRQDTGLVRSPVRESLFSRSEKDLTSTNEGGNCIFPVTTVTSPRSELETEDKLKEEL